MGLVIGTCIPRIFWSEATMRLSSIFPSATGDRHVLIWPHWKSASVLTRRSPIMKHSGIGRILLRTCIQQKRSSIHLCARMGMNRIHESGRAFDGFVGRLCRIKKATTNMRFVWPLSYSVVPRFRGMTRKSRDMPIF